MRILLILFFAQITLYAVGQKRNYIEGNIDGYTKKDSIFFFRSYVPSSDYETDTLKSEIVEGKFSINNTFTYPHLFYSILQSDMGSILAESKFFFIDSETKHISIDFKNWDVSSSDGYTSAEFEGNFKDFLLSKTGCSTDEWLMKILYEKDVSIDSVLFNYTSLNRESYVSLWLLSERFHYLGYTKLRDDVLGLFSETIKEKVLWKNLKNEIDSAQIKKGNIFPLFKVRDVADNETSIHLPKAKLILVDLWFSFCKPCIQSIPTLRSLHDKYGSKGFEILGISTDPTFTKQKWLKAIDLYKMDWAHYVDVGGDEVKKLKINSFPRYILIDGRGEIINADMNLKEVESFIEHSDYL